MITVISAVAYGLLSAVLLYLSAVSANKRLATIEGEAVPKPYTLGAKAVIGAVSIVAVSALCGAITSQNTVSILALIELGVCYLACLSAAVIDLKTKTIPNLIVLTLVGARTVIFIYELIFTDTAIAYLISSLIGWFACALLLIIANRITGGGIGAGDVKLLSAMGFMCGLYVVCSALMLALVFCILTSVALIALKKRTSKDLLPFGPFIYLGMTAISLFTLY